MRGIAENDAGKAYLAEIGISLPITKNTIRKLAREQAMAMFRRQFWDALKLDLLPQRQAILLYDAAVNSGNRQAVRLSQRGYNRCFLAPLDVDGLMGPKTRAALQRDTDCMVVEILQARREFYQSLAKAKPSQKVFLKGWLNRVNDLEKYLAGIK